MLKAIEIEFKTKKFLINKWVILINRYTCEFIMRQIEKGMQKVYAMKSKYAAIQQNMMELMMNIIECYKGGYNELRKTVIQHCLNLVSADVFSQEEFKHIQIAMLSLRARLNPRIIVNFMHSRVNCNHIIESLLFNHTFLEVHIPRFVE